MFDCARWRKQVESQPRICVQVVFRVVFFILLDILKQTSVTIANLTGDSMSWASAVLEDLALKELVQIHVVLPK